jgi:outer membrane lipoprotein SlyB
MENAMENSARLHPLLSAAAISVIVLSAAGVGALTGVLPHSVSSQKTPDAAATPAASPALPVVTPLAPAVPALAPAPEPSPAKKQVIRTRAPVAPKKATPAAEPARDFAEDDFWRASETPRAAEPKPEVAAAPKCTNCGTVEAVREIEHKGEGTGIGAVAGGVAGAVVGRQFGNGSGRTVMTILGAAGGAYAGHEIEKKARTTKRWEVSVRLDDGSYRSVSLDTQPAWRSGDRVRYVNGALEPERV